jgi:hypothetical protein
MKVEVFKVPMSGPDNLDGLAFLIREKKSIRQKSLLSLQRLKVMEMLMTLREALRLSHFNPSYPNIFIAQGTS